MKKVLQKLYLCGVIGFSSQMFAESDSTLQKGYEAMLLGKVSDAEKYFKKACNNKEMRGCLELVTLGDTVEDEKKSFELYRYACDKHAIEIGCEKIASFYANKNDFTNGFKYAKKSCNNHNKVGNAGTYFGCNLLGKMYVTGKGTVANFQKAFETFSMSCEVGNEESCELANKVHQLIRK